MGRNFKRLSVVLIIALIFIISYALRPEKTNLVRSIGENQIIIDNFEMSKVLDKKNSFYKVTADTADVDRENDITKLKNFHVYYKKGKSVVDVTGPAATVDSNEKAEASGTLKGNVNGADFFTGENGEFYYDFLLKKGYLKNDVTIQEGPLEIKADLVDIYGETGVLDFKGGVKVRYE